MFRNTAIKLVNPDYNVSDTMKLEYKVQNAVKSNTIRQMNLSEKIVLDKKVKSKSKSKCC